MPEEATPETKKETPVSEKTLKRARVLGILTAVCLTVTNIFSLTLFGRLAEGVLGRFVGMASIFIAVLALLWVALLVVAIKNVTTKNWRIFIYVMAIYSANHLLTKFLPILISGALL